MVVGRVREKKSNVRQILLTGTPRGFDFVYDYFQEKKPDRMMVMVSTYENAKNLAPEYIANLKSAYDAKNVQQYVEGMFVNTKAGRVYYAWDRNLNIRTAKYNPNLPIIITVDFNVDPMVWGIVQNYGDTDCLIDEIVQRDTNTLYMTRELLRRYPNARGYHVYGDYSGTFRHTSAPSTDYKIMEKEIPGMILITKPNPNVIDRINVVNARLCDAVGKRRLFVSKNCEMHIKDFEQVSWMETKKDIDKRDRERTHATDGLGYYLEEQYSLRGKPQVTHKYRKAG